MNQLYTNRQLSRLIIPLIFEQFLNTLVGVVDTLMVSQAGEAAVSGVALTTNINILIIQVMAALATGGAVVCSQYNGSKKISHAKHAAGQLETVLFAFALFAMAFCLIGGRHLLGFIFGKVENSVMSSACTYMYVTAISYPFLGIYNAGAAIFRSTGNSKISLKISLLMNVLNIGFNAWFVFGMHWDVFGVACATLISRIAAGLIMSLLVSRPSNPLQITTFKVLLPKKQMIMRILRIGIPSGVENSMFQIGKLAVVSMVAGFGTAAIAANTVSYSIIDFPNMPAASMGLALVTVVGNCIGAGEKEQVRYYVKKLLLVAYIGDWIMNLLLLISAPFLVSFFHLSAEASGMAVEVLRYFAVTSLFIWPLSFTLPNALRATGDAKYTMIAGITSMWLFRVLCSYFLAVVCSLGILGVWLGMFVDWGVRSMLFVTRFLSGKWEQKKVI